MVKGIEGFPLMICPRVCGWIGIVGSTFCTTGVCGWIGIVCLTFCTTGGACSGGAGGGRGLITVAVAVLVGPLETGAAFLFASGRVAFVGGVSDLSVLMMFLSSLPLETPLIDVGFALFAIELLLCLLNTGVNFMVLGAGLAAPMTAGFLAATGGNAPMTAGLLAATGGL